MKKILSFALCMILVFAMPITSATAKTSVPTSGSLSKSKISISRSDAIAKGYTACARCKP